MNDLNPQNDDTKRYVFMLFGYVGAGKSFVAKWLAPHKQAVHLRADGMRFMMFDGDRPELYTPENKVLVNKAVHYAGQQILISQLASLVFDGNHNQRARRDEIAELARKHGAEPVIVWIKTPQETAKARIKSRAETEGHVIFDPNIIENMLKTTDMPASDERVIELDGLQSAAEQQASFDEQLTALFVSEKAGHTA